MKLKIKIMHFKTNFIFYHYFVYFLHFHIVFHVHCPAWHWGAGKPLPAGNQLLFLGWEMLSYYWRKAGSSNSLAARAGRGAAPLGWSCSALAASSSPSSPSSAGASSFWPSRSPSSPSFYKYFGRALCTFYWLGEKTSLKVVIYINVWATFSSHIPPTFPKDSPKIPPRFPKTPHTRYEPFRRAVEHNADG